MLDLSWAWQPASAGPQPLDLSWGWQLAGAGPRPRPPRSQAPGAQQRNPKPLSAAENELEANAAEPVGAFARDSAAKPDRYAPAAAAHFWRPRRDERFAAGLLAARTATSSACTCWPTEAAEDRTALSSGAFDKELAPIALQPQRCASRVEDMATEVAQCASNVQTSWMSDRGGTAEVCTRARTVRCCARS